jgi:predicted nucleic acid-binding protein
LKGFLVDSGYLYALYREEGDRTKLAREILEKLISTRRNVLLIPWPVLYERFNSEFSGRPDWIERLNSDLSRLRRLKISEYVDDAPFRESCLDEWLGLSPERPGRYPGVSLVDRILMALVEDPSKSIEALLTFDLRDFSGFCAKRGIEIIPGRM